MNDQFKNLFKGIVFILRALSGCLSASRPHTHGSFRR